MLPPMRQPDGKAPRALSPWVLLYKAYATPPPGCTFGCVVECSVDFRGVDCSQIARLRENNPLRHRPEETLTAVLEHIRH
jgi:hypothetical protein